jgi:phosphoribosylanthranilate isomerase
MPKIKICGLFREQDVEFANEAKPDFIGFVLAEKSRRFVDFKQAENLRKNLAEEIISVGVFVNAKIDDIVSLHKSGIVSMVQLHGGETDEYIENLRNRCEAKIIRALNLSAPFFAAASLEGNCHYTLLDSKSPGSGHAFDWESLRNIDLSKNVFLAGGVNLENIKEAMEFNPFAVDVSSGAETGGAKDREKILKLVKAVRRG